MKLPDVTVQFDVSERKGLCWAGTVHTERNVAVMYDIYLHLCMHFKIHVHVQTTLNLVLLDFLISIGSVMQR